MIEPGTPFLVAEITKNWINGQSVEGDDPRRLADVFETTLLEQFHRGYHLHSFQLHQLHREKAGQAQLVETIVAVFERMGLR